LPRGVRLLTVIDRQREEIQPFAARFGNNRHECHRIANSNDDRAGCLFCEMTRLDAQQLAADGPLDKPARNQNARHVLYPRSRMDWGELKAMGAASDYLRIPRRLITSRYFFRSLSRRYFSRLDLLDTIISSPRRLAWSLACVLK